MKPKISEQDRTDYALNELGPEGRIYVETMLAGSEEAREDVYQMIDLAMMLDEGFEWEAEQAPAELTAAQRQALLTVRVPNYFLRRASTVLAAAACFAFALLHHDAWLPRLPLPRTTAAAGAPQPGGLQAGAAGAETDFVSQLLQFRQLAEDPALRKWFLALPSAASPIQPVNFEPTQRATLDFMP